MRILKGLWGEVASAPSKLMANEMALENALSLGCLGLSHAVVAEEGAELHENAGMKEAADIADLRLRDRQVHDADPSGRIGIFEGLSPN